MNTKIVFTAAVAAIAFSIAACGPEEPAVEPFPTPPPQAEWTPPTTAAPRAAEIAVGQPNTMHFDGGTVQFTVNALTPITGADCDSIYDGDPGKQFLRMDLTVQTGDVAPSDYNGLFSPGSWKVRGDDGRVIDDPVMDDDAWMCTLDDGADLYEFETNSIYSTVIVVPQQSGSGTIILEPSEYESGDRFELRY